jgi:hypothetical protein
VKTQTFINFIRKMFCSIDISLKSFVKDKRSSLLGLVDEEEKKFISIDTWTAELALFAFAKTSLGRDAALTFGLEIKERKVEEISKLIHKLILISIKATWIFDLVVQAAELQLLSWT